MRHINRANPSDPPHKASVELLPDGTGRTVVPSWRALDGTDLIFSCNFPPGHWTFVPAGPHFATFPPEPLLVEASAIKAVEQDSPIEVTIRATLAQ